MNFGNKIKYLRKKDNMSQQELANKLKINRNNLSRIETGKSEPNASLIIKIANLFKIDVNSLLNIDYDEPSHEEKIKYIIENCKMLPENDLDFVLRVIEILNQEYVKKK